jgi:hypothetical protein
MGGGIGEHAGGDAWRNEYAATYTFGIIAPEYATKYLWHDIYHRADDAHSSHS